MGRFFEVLGVQKYFKKSQVVKPGFKTKYFATHRFISWQVATLQSPFPLSPVKQM
jgi:hypothetical protein